MIAFLILHLLLGAGLPRAQGRMPFRRASHRLLDEQAADPVFPLLGSTLASSRSPLLDAPHNDGWVTVAAPRRNSTHADDVLLETRIIDGEVDTGNKLFPYAAYLEWAMDGGQTTTCSGALIAPAWVITAAQCLSHNGSQAQPAQMSIWISGTWYETAAVYAHSGYNGNEGFRNQPSNDIGLVQLTVPSSTPTVSLLYSQSPLPAVGSTVWAAGYGFDESGKASDVLRYTDLTTFKDGDPSQCPAQGFTDNFCAGGTNGYTCSGDSGGPVVMATDFGDVLVGMTSWGPEDCRVHYAFYVSVQPHLDWVFAIMSGNVTSAGGTGTTDSSSDVSCWFTGGC